MGAWCRSVALMVSTVVQCVMGQSWVRFLHGWRNTTVLSLPVVSNWPSTRWSFWSLKFISFIHLPLFKAAFTPIVHFSWSEPRQMICCCIILLVHFVLTLTQYNWLTGSHTSRDKNKTSWSVVLWVDSSVTTLFHWQFNEELPKQGRYLHFVCWRANVLPW